MLRILSPYCLIFVSLHLFPLHSPTHTSLSHNQVIPELPCVQEERDSGELLFLLFCVTGTQKTAGSLESCFLEELSVIKKAVSSRVSNERSN